MTRLEEDTLWFERNALYLHKLSLLLRVYIKQKKCGLQFMYLVFGQNGGKRMKMKQRSWRIMFASSNRLAASKAVLVTRGLGRADIIHL